MEKWAITDVKTCLLSCSFDSRGKYAQTDSDKAESGTVSMRCSFSVTLPTHVLRTTNKQLLVNIPFQAMSRERPPARVTSCLPRSGCVASIVLTPCSGEQKLGAAASAHGHELGPLFPPRGWPVPSGPGSTRELISNADSQVLPQHTTAVEPGSQHI